MQERVCLGKRLKIGIRASSTLAWYKNGGRENDKVMYNFEHGAELVLQSARLESRDCKVNKLPATFALFYVLSLGYAHAQLRWFYLVSTLALFT